MGLFSSVIAPTGRVSEAFGGVSARDEAIARAGFRRITAPGSQVIPPRDLHPLAQEQMLRIAFYQWQQNAIAQWMIETTIDFTLGEGASVEADDDDLRDVIQKFWCDPVNQLDRRLDSFAREFRLYGELILPAFTNEADGHVRLGYVDPLEVDKIIADPDNLLLLTAVVLKGRTGSEQRGKVLKVIRPETDRASADYGYLMGVRPGERDPFLGVTYDGATFLHQTNKLSNGQRGRSDLLPLFDWCDGYDQWLFDSLDQATLFNSFVWDATLEGASEPQIAEWLEKNKTLKRNQIFAHNEKLTLEPKVADLKAMDKDTFARQIRGNIVGTRSFPEHWFGLAGDVNFASAKEMGLPPVKRLSRIQNELRYLITDLVTFQIHQAILAGRLKAEVTIATPTPAPMLPMAAQNGSAPPTGPVKEAATTKPADQAFRVILPELSLRDQSAIVAATTGLSSSLQQAVGQGWIRGETASRVFCSLLSQLGLEIDPKEEFQEGGPTLAAYTGAGGQQDIQRLIAQLGRQGNGNGDNAGQPKATTPVGGQTGNELPNDQYYSR